MRVSGESESLGTKEFFKIKLSHLNHEEHDSSLIYKHFRSQHLRFLYGLKIHIIVSI